jgi:hypothetical protein
MDKQRKLVRLKKEKIKRKSNVLLIIKFLVAKLQEDSKFMTLE